MLHYNNQNIKFKDFYENVYDVPQDYVDSPIIGEFIDTTKIKKLTEEEADELEGDISISELNKVLAKTKKEVVQVLMELHPMSLKIVHVLLKK